MSALAKTDHSDAAGGPTVHLEFIQTQARLPGGGDVDAVEAYHRAVFLHRYGGDLERFQQQTQIHQQRVEDLDARLREIRSKLGPMDRATPVEFDGAPDVKPVAPWNAWDISMFCAALLGILALLLFGVLNISFNLLESGLITFVENPVRAYFWAALLPVGALAIKVGWDCIKGSRAREIYLWGCLLIGIAGVIVWVAAYSAVYPTLSVSTAEQIDSFSVFDDSTVGSGVLAGGAKWIDAVIVAAQAMAEIFLSAVLGMYMTIIYSRHRPVRLARNPLFAQLDEERRNLEDSVAAERLALAEARGNESRLTHQLAALLAYARSLFQQELAVHEDQTHRKRLLLNQISEELKAQLDHVDNGARMDAGAAVTGRNGR